MHRYDPFRPADPCEWLDLDEDERLDLVIKYHKSIRQKLPNIRLHAAFHVIVENQLAEHLPSVDAAFQRLRAEGLDRHDAVHAIASVVAQHFHNIMKGDAPAVEPNEAYYHALENLSAATWRAS